MPRKTRMYLPGVPAHVVQRGNNRAACFFCDDDYRYYLERLGVGLRRCGVALHAYVLMTNHVHLLLTPGSAEGISHLMQHVGRHYVLYINRHYRRSGTLWEGRHKASLVQAERYLLSCMRYIELNPVTAGMVATAEQYRWSSYRTHAWGEPSALLEEHALFTQLGPTPSAQRQAYRELFAAPVDEREIHEIRTSVANNFPLGNARFKDQIEAMTGRRVGHLTRGRPRRKLATEDK